MDTRLEKMSQLKVGEEGIITSFGAKDGDFLIRLWEMGLTSGVRVKVEKIAPLGDPVSIKVRGYELCLRKSTLKDITIMKQDLGLTFIEKVGEEKIVEEKEVVPTNVDYQK